MKRLCLKRSASFRPTGNYKLISEKEEKSCVGAGGSPQVPTESRAPKLHASPPGRRIQHDGHVVHKRLMVSARAASSKDPKQRARDTGVISSREGDTDRERDYLSI